MAEKVKVPGGAFYAGDGLTVDPITRTVSAGGGDVATPDWNQNDATASDYIKNRPGGYDAQQQQTDSGSYKFTYSGGKGTYDASAIASDIIDNSQTVDVTIVGSGGTRNFQNVPVIQDSNGKYVGDNDLVEYPFCLNYPVYVGGGNYEKTSYTNITPTISGGSINISVTGMGAISPVKFNSKYIDVPANIGTGNTTSGWNYNSFAVGIDNYPSSDGFAVGTNNNVDSYIGAFGRNINGEFNPDSSGAIIVGQYNTNSFTRSQKPTLVLGSGNSTTATTVFWADATNGHFLIPVTMTECQPDTLILKSSTSGSTKKFKITVDDTGAITATTTT